MKNTKLIAMILFLGLIAISCKKEVAGPQGAAGKDGKDGNANVTLYSYGPQTFTGTLYRNEFSMPGMTTNKIDSSMIVAYYRLDLSTAWYEVGQLGKGSDYQTRGWILTNSTSYNIRLAMPDGSNYIGPDVIWDSVRVFVVPANTFISAINQNVNFDDYKSVSAFFDKK